MGTLPTPRFVLRDLPLPARLVLSIFLLSVGVGYVSALVQLHFQHASKGEFMPGPDQTIRVFHDRTYNLPPPKKESDDLPKPQRPQGRIEQLLVADPNQKLRPSTQMRTAFSKDSEDWEEEIVRRPGQLRLSVDEAKASLVAEREGERLAVLAWLQADGPKAPYDQDTFTLPADWKPEQPITAKYVLNDGKAVKLKSIFTDRCVVCHQIGREADKVPFVSFDQIQKYIPEPTPTNIIGANGPLMPRRQPGMSIEKLAQSSHVHLLGFSMLYCLTGFVLAFTSYPLVVRCVLCPLPLLVQVLDIACWWLAREDKPYGPMFAMVIPITGGVVAMGLVSHILLSVFNMFGGAGKLVLVLLFAGAGAGAFLYVKPIVEAEIRREKEESAPTQPNPADSKKSENAAK